MDNDEWWVRVRAAHEFWSAYARTLQHEKKRHPRHECEREQPPRCCCECKHARQDRLRSRHREQS